MLKKAVRKWLPNPKTIQRQRYLRIFGKRIYDPNLWGLTRYSTATAVSIGLFITFFPLPGHLIVAACLSLLLRANLPLALALCWVVNPITIVPMFGFAFAVGAYVLGIPLQSVNFKSLSAIYELWQPFVVGSLICGSALAFLGNLATRALWRYSVAKNWQRRKLRSRQKTLVVPESNP